MTEETNDRAMLAITCFGCFVFTIAIGIELLVRTGVVQ